MTQFRSLVATLMSVLHERGGGFGVDAVEHALAGSDEELKAFLVSNDLWGGAGSIADQAGADRAARRVIQSALIELGQEQISIESPFDGGDTMPSDVRCEDYH